MSTGAEVNKQSPNAGQPDSSGGNSVGPALKAPNLYQPAKFMDKSGTPDNQSTNRPKGST
jgi:hypothetical protein